MLFLECDPREDKATKIGGIVLRDGERDGFETVYAAFRPSGAWNPTLNLLETNNEIVGVFGHN